MAQVRKFQSGGKTFKIAGYTFDTSNADDMKLFQELASDSNLGGIAQSVLDNVNDNAYSGTLNMYRTADGKVVSEGELQHIKDKHMSAGTQKATSRKDTAFWNAVKRRSGREWANDMDAFISEVARRKATGTSTPSGDNKIKITGVGNINGGKWGYNEQGWNEADINNAAMMKEWQLLEDYFNASEEDRKNKYDVSGLDNRALEAYINMRQNNPKLYEQYKSKFIDNAEKIADNDDFYSTYGWFGFTPGSAEEIAAAKAAVDNKALKEYLATQGLDFDGAENVFYRDKDGNLMVTDAFLTNVLGGDRNGHYWLNDNWANLKTDNGNTNPYSHMRDHIIWNGRVYKQDDAAVLAELQKSGYIDANKAYDAAKAEQIMRTQWSDSPTFAHEAYDFDNMFSEWAHNYKDKGLRYRRLEGNDLVKEGQELIGYYSNEDPTDNYGLRTERYAIIGSDGKLIKDNVNPAEYAKMNNGLYIPGTASFMQKRLGKDAGALAGTYIDGTSIAGKPSNTFFYQNPDTGEFFIQDPDLKGRQKGKAVRIPKEIATMIPEEAWEYFRTNKDAKDRLFQMLKDFTNTGFGKKMRQYYTFGLESLREMNLRRDFRKAGLSEEQSNQIVDLFNKWGSNKYYKEQTGKHDTSAIARQQAFLADPQTGDIVQPAFKEGGKIEKHQYGKVLGQQGKTELKTVNLKESNVKDANTNQSFGLGSKDSKQWSSLDTMELAGAAADLAALGITIVDPTNIVGALAGAAGSLTNFGVDVKRDGFQGKDLGRLALNLVLDAGTLIPILGDGLQGAKAVHAMKKAAPVLAKAIKTGAIVGVGDAVYNTIDKIAKGESFTISDVRRIINGISGGVTLNRTGLLNQTKHRIDVDPGLTIKGKPNSGVADIKLSKEQISEVMSVPKAEQMKKLTEVLKAAGHDVNKLDLDSIAKTMKRPQWKFWKGWDKTAVPDISKGGSKRVDLTPEDLAKLQRERNGFQNWFFGTGKAQRAYNAFLRGEQPTFSHKINIKETPYWETGYKPTIDIPEGSAPGLVPMEYFARQITPKTQIVSSHASPFGKRFFLRPVLPNIVSTQQFPQEMEFTENVNTIPMKRLVFKKGGVLKAQKGIWDIAAGILKENPIDLSGKPTVNPDTGLFGPNLDIAGMARRSTLETKPIEPLLQSKPVNTNYALDHSNKHAQTWANDRKIADPSSARPSGGNNNIDWNYVAKETLGAANAIRAINDAYKLKDISDRKADALGRLAPSIWNDKGRMRFQTPTLNLVNQEIAANNTIANTLKTSDSALNIAGKLQIADMNSKIRNQGNRQIATEYDNALQNHINNQMQNDQFTFQSVNNWKQGLIPDVSTKFGGEAQLTTDIGAITDKYNNAWQSFLNRKGLVSVAAQNKIDQLNLMRAQPGLTSEQIKAIDDQIKMIGSPEYQNILRNQYKYGVTFAKKGTKLRSTTEQMLLDNNKLVARAIEKLNDNTMKLILKALS